MRRIYLALLAIVMMVVAAPTVTQAQSNEPPYGYYPGTDHPLCPPLEGYKWPGFEPGYGEWTNTGNFTNHLGEDFGCRVEFPNEEAPIVIAPYGYYEDTNDELCPPLDGYKFPGSEPNYGEWSNTTLYNNHTGRDFRCRTQRPEEEPPNLGLAPVRNTNATFEQYSGTPSAELDADQDGLTTYLGDNLNGAPCDLANSACRRWDGGSEPGGGNFRVTCQYSHFNYDDPIIHPGMPGRPGQGHHHLHMFFGNTTTDAFTSPDSDDPNFVASRGGGSCNGFALNRSAYWTPAVLDGNGNAVVPFQILVYYKSLTSPGTDSVAPHVPADVAEMPQGLQLVAGNTRHADDNFDGTSWRPSYNESELTFWSCGFNGLIVDDSKQRGIPSDCGDQPINATIYFPQCWDGENLTPYTNDAGVETTHIKQARYGSPCPDGYETRLPQIGILLYYAPQDTSGWTLSSDNGSAAGSTLHADWFGGWHNDTMSTWTNSCIRTERNCTLGQTGTSRTLTRLDQGTGYNADDYGLKSDDFGFIGTELHENGGRRYTGTFGDLSQYLVPISEVDYPSRMIDIESKRRVHPVLIFGPRPT